MRSGPEAVKVESLAVVSSLMVKEEQKCCGGMGLSIGPSAGRS